MLAQAAQPASSFRGARSASLESIGPLRKL